MMSRRMSKQGGYGSRRAAEGSKMRTPREVYDLLSPEDRLEVASTDFSEGIFNSAGEIICCGEEHSPAFLRSHPFASCALLEYLCEVFAATLLVPDAPDGSRTDTEWAELYGVEEWAIRFRRALGTEPQTAYVS